MTTKDHLNPALPAEERVDLLARQMTLFMSSGGLGNAVGVDPGMSGWNAVTLPPITSSTCESTPSAG
jgi:hypothetical protein